MSKVSLTRAEFDVQDKVHFWNGVEFKQGAILGIKLNPIDNIIEYKLFFRKQSSSGKRGRESVITTPYFIQESVHFKEPKKTGLKGTAL